METRKLIICRGIQGSGKSTWAKQWCHEDPEHRVRFNNDDIRNMLGYEIVSPEEVSHLQSLIQKAKDSDVYDGKVAWSFCVGTNEEVEISAQEALWILENAKSISTEEAKIISSCLGKENGFTFFNDLMECVEEDLLDAEALEEESEEEEEE